MFRLSDEIKRWDAMDKTTARDDGFLARHHTLHLLCQNQVLRSFSKLQWALK